MPTTFANTIDENELLAKRSQCDYAGNDIQTTYATKSELPTATSDLTNDSDFITSSDVPVKDVQVAGTSVVNAQGIAEISIPQTGVLDVEVDGSSVVNAQGVAEITLPTFTQVNADWDASSGVSEILNKPNLSIYAESSDLATVATSGSYNDLLDKPSIPSAQVNADWDATSGVSAILNKPNLATVATTGDYSDLQNLPSIPAAQVNSDWSATSGVAQILNKPSIPTATSDLTNDSDFITLSDVPAQVNADWNATSGVAEILNKPTIPSYTAGNGIDITSNVISAKVDGTTIDTNASGELTVIGGGGGGGSQVNSDWDATSGVAEILNKPTPKTLTAGTGISITDGVSTITISSNVTAPVQDVTVNGTSVVSNGVATITVDQTYDASSANAQSGVAVAEGLSAKADVFNVGDGLNFDTTGITPVVKFDTPTQYTTYTDVVASKAHASVSTVFTAIVLGPFVTLSGNYDPMAAITVSNNADTLLCALKDEFKPVMDTYVTNYPGNGSIPYGGLHIAPNGNVYIHQNGTTNSQTRFFSVTYMRQM